MPAISRQRMAWLSALLMARLSFSPLPLLGRTWPARRGGPALAEPAAGMFYAHFDGASPVRAARSRPRAGRPARTSPASRYMHRRHDVTYYDGGRTAWPTGR